MGSTTIEYRKLPGTKAAIGRSGNHHVIADRPPGRDGGMGLGFNGGELLAFALGGCLCNDLQSVAHEMNVSIEELHVSVTVDFEGHPTLATGARLSVECTLADGSDPSELIDRAKAQSTISNSLKAAMSVQIERA